MLCTNGDFLLHINFVYNNENVKTFGAATISIQNLDSKLKMKTKHKWKDVYYEDDLHVDGDQQQQQ